jgi:hypothetical protein
MTESREPSVTEERLEAALDAAGALYEGTPFPPSAITDLLAVVREYAALRSTLATREQELAEANDLILLLAVRYDWRDEFEIDAGHLFKRGWLRAREVADTGEYEAEITLQGHEAIRAALAHQPTEEADRG